MESDDWASVTLMNLSVGGTFFYYKKDLGIGTLLDLKIDVPEFLIIINCVGEVTRIEQFKTTSMFCTAIKFIHIGEVEKAMINTSDAEALEYEDQTSLT